jgi:hypothetical protein
MPNAQCPMPDHICLGNRRKPHRKGVRPLRDPRERVAAFGILRRYRFKGSCFLASAA